MKSLTNTPDLQPDVDAEDMAPQVCARCAHYEVDHEMLGEWYDGPCEIHDCDCAAFTLFLDEEAGR